MKSQFAVFLIPFIVSCSWVVPPMQSFSVHPSHPLADVYVDGNLKGKGSQTIQLHRSSSHQIMAKCEDSSGMGSAGSVTINRSISMMGLLDIIGGVIWLVPFLGVLAPGFWKLSPESISVAIPNEALCQ